VRSVKARGGSGKRPLFAVKLEGGWSEEGVAENAHLFAVMFVGRLERSFKPKHGIV